MTEQEYQDALKVLYDLAVANNDASTALVILELRRPGGLSTSEAIYGFVAWLAGRKKVTSIGASQDASAITILVNDFCQANNLPEPRGEWIDNLTHPK